MPSTLKYSLPSAERGATLLVAMMMLLLLTIIGLAAVRSSTQQVRMSANAQSQHSAFHAAEMIIRKTMAEVRGQTPPPPYIVGGISTLMENSLTVPQLRCYPDPAALPATCAADPATGMTHAATMSYTGQYASRGSSMGVGAGSMVAHRFRIDATGQAGGAGATSLQEQGIERIGPGA